MLVHGAEGTDTTLLVTALAQLILDPSCRTLEGFQGLLEREWIEVRAAIPRGGRGSQAGWVPSPRIPLGVPQAGHPFQLRCARSASSHGRGKQEAPLFLLFLDCVWQLSRQFPFSLEFGEQLLLTLFDNAYASAYGTFLCNNEKERSVWGHSHGHRPPNPCWARFGCHQTLLGTETRPTCPPRSLCKVKESTHSLWAWLNQPEEKQKLLNPLYSHNPLVIWPSVEPQSIQLWQGERDPPEIHPQLRAGLAQGKLL